MQNWTKLDMAFLANLSSETRGHGWVILREILLVDQEKHPGESPVVFWPRGRRPARSNEIAYSGCIKISSEVDRWIGR